jgi:tetratricopeptide (TPR) repeat protein
MKPKPLLTVLLALAISGGLLWAFPTQWMGLVLVLLALLAAQATLIRRSMTVVRADQSAPAVRLSRAVAAAGLAPAFANRSGSSAKPALDPAAFARFRAHLETVESERGLRPEAPPLQRSHAPAESAAAPAGAAAAKPRGAPSGEPTVSDTSAVADRVALSGAARAPSGTAQAPAGTARAPAGAASAPPKPAPATPKMKSPSTYGPPRRVVMPGAKPPSPSKQAGTAPPEPAAPAEDADGPDLFADLRPNRAGTLPSRPAAPQPAPPDELEARLNAAPENDPQADDAAALLRLAEEAVRRGDLRAGRAALEQHLELVPAEQASPAARRLHVRVAALGNEPQQALDAFEALLKAGFALKPEAVPALLDDLLDGARADLADSLRVSLLLKTLAAFRQATNRPAMDAVYRLLVEAQERVGDERKLVQFLKNHLEIKKVMGEAAGQLELIDQIGNRLFKLGETAEAREYYELGLKIRADVQQAEQAPAATKTGTTPQTA